MLKETWCLENFASWKPSTRKLFQRHIFSDFLLSIDWLLLSFVLCKVLHFATTEYCQSFNNLVFYLKTGLNKITRVFQKFKTLCHLANITIFHECCTFLSFTVWDQTCDECLLTSELAVQSDRSMKPRSVQTIYLCLFIDSCH